MRFDWFLKKVELRQPVSDLTWDSRMFVVHVIDHLDEDGAEHFLIQLMRAQVESGWRVGVVTLGEPNTLVHDIYGSGILYRGCDRARLDDPRLLLDLVGVLQRLGPDVVHTHLFHADLFGRLAARLAGVAAIVSTAHSTAAWALSGKRRAAMRWSTRLGHRMVAVSETVQQSAAAHLRLPVPRIDVIPNGIDLEPLARAQALPRADLGLSAANFVVGCVGRMVEAKGFDVLLRGVARLIGTAPAPDAPPVRVLMVGEGTARRALRELVDGLGLGTYVRWLGLRKDVPQLLKTLDVFALPATCEGHTVALLEAMGAACACLVSDIAEFAEIVADAALRVPPGDDVAIAAALQELRQDPARRTWLGQAAQAAVQRFSIAQAAARYLALYREVLGMGGARQAPASTRPSG